MFGLEGNQRVSLSHAQNVNHINGRRKENKMDIRNLSNQEKVQFRGIAETIKNYNINVVTVKKICKILLTKINKLEKEPLRGNKKKRKGIELSEKDRLEIESFLKFKKEEYGFFPFKKELKILKEIKTILKKSELETQHKFLILDQLMYEEKRKMVEEAEKEFEEIKKREPHVWGKNKV